MKIYTEVVCQWQPDGTLKRIEEKYEEYDGLVSYCKKGGSAPPPPDYTGAAIAQGQANKEAAIATSQLSNPNITTPYGSQTIEYRTDPLTGNPVPYITQNLSKEQQGLLNQYNAIDAQLGNLSSQGLQYVQNTLNKPFDQSLLPRVAVNPGQTYSEAAFARLQPEVERSTQQLETKLANQGITPGSEAYNNAIALNNQSINDLRQQIAAGSLNADQAARQQALQEQSFFRNEPLNTLNAVRSSAQIQNPQFQGFQGANVQAAPLFAATQAQNQADINQYNANTANRNSQMQGIQGLAGLGLTSAMFF